MTLVLWKWFGTSGNGLRYFYLQTDYFGLAGTIHVLIHGQYMKVYQEAGVWKASSNFIRYFLQFYNSGRIQARVTTALIF